MKINIFILLAVCVALSGCNKHEPSDVSCLYQYYGKDEKQPCAKRYRLVAVGSRPSQE